MWHVTCRFAANRIPHTAVRVYGFLSHIRYAVWDKTARHMPHERCYVISFFLDFAFVWCINRVAIPPSALHTTFGSQPKNWHMESCSHYYYLLDFWPHVPHTAYHTPHYAYKDSCFPWHHLCLTISVTFGFNVMVLNERSQFSMHVQ